jgi:hypothetical protein
MTIQEKHEDSFLKELIQRGSIEKAPDGFTDKVMNALDTEKEQLALPWWSRSNLWFWSSIFMGVIALVSIVFFIDFSFMGGIFEGIKIDEVMISQVTNEIGRELLGMSEGFEVSSISFVILAAFGALFILDRLLRRKPDVEFKII